MARSNGTAPPKTDALEEKLEQAIMAQLDNTSLEPDERNKAIGNAIRWCAVKAKLILKDHGAGFLEDEE